MEEPYKIGLILIGMTPCAPFLPMLANKAKGDLGATAALMLLTAVVTIIFVPLAVPLMAKGLTVSAWTIAQPLLIFVLLPLVVGMVTRRASLVVTRRMQPFVKRTTGIFTIVVVVLCGIVYGKGLLGLPGSLAIVSQVIFFFIMATVTYWFGFGLKHEEKIVLSLGMTTRNLGAAVAPLFSIANIDERAIIMVVLGIPLMVVSSVLSTIFFRTKG
jgi:BASS family bile acid:Na+ symporter